MATGGMTVLLIIVGSVLLVGGDRVPWRDVRRMMATYNKADPPTLDKPTDVKIGIYVNNIQLDYQMGSMRMNTYFRMAWKDERFKEIFNSTPSADPVKFTDDLIDSAWRPDLFIRNSDKVERVNALVPEHLFRVNSTGHVWYVVRMIKTVYCPKVLSGRRKVNCNIMFESYGHTMDTLTISWLDHPVDVDPGVALLSHQLNDVAQYDCSQNYTAGRFPCLQLDFKMERKLSMNTFEAGIFLSSILLVVISWLGFWMPHDHHRLFLGVGVGVILALLFVAVVGWRPYSFTGHISTAQLWLTMCFALTFAMVLEYALVYVLFTAIPAKLKRACGKAGPNTDQPQTERPHRLAEVIDIICGLVIFPGVFIVCIIVIGVKAGQLA